MTFPSTPFLFWLFHVDRCVIYLLQKSRHPVRVEAEGWVVPLEITDTGPPVQDEPDRMLKTEFVLKYPGFLCLQAEISAVAWWFMTPGTCGLLFCLQKSLRNDQPALTCMWCWGDVTRCGRFRFVKNQAGSQQRVPAFLQNPSHYCLFFFSLGVCISHWTAVLRQEPLCLYVCCMWGCICATWASSYPPSSSQAGVYRRLPVSKNHLQRSLCHQLLSLSFHLLRCPARSFIHLQSPQFYTYYLVSCYFWSILLRG